MECPEKEGWWGDLMTGGCNEISHKYTLTNTYRQLAWEYPDHHHLQHSVEGVRRET